MMEPPKKDYTEQIKELLKECEKKYNKQYYKNYYKENKVKLRARYYKKKEERELEKSRLYKLFLEQTLENDWKEYYRKNVGE